MRGFPIVSLGSVSTITIKSDRFSTQILSPNFEKQEYFENNENDTIEYWKKKYSKAYEFGYIKNILIQENNIDSTNGDMSFISYSTGFDPYVDIEDYENYEFDALVVNKKIRITDLDADTKYSIMVYSDAYVNNYSQDIPKEDRTYEVSRSHSVYTTDSYGVTFGHDISYVITDNSYIVLFRSGTNFDNVVNVNYSISLDDEFNGGLIVSGTDTIGDKNKFEFNDESGYGMYVITRNDGIKNTEGMYYLITLSFDVKDPNDPEKLVNLTAAYNPSFTASVAYVKDMENNN